MLRNEQKILISVIIPVYNAENYINRCVSSIVNQTYENLEIIIINDGSTDGSGRICDEWKEKDKRIHVYHKKNEGPGIARNIGIEMSKGEYLAFIDSDDWIEDTAYETFINIALKSGAEIVGCASIVDYENGLHKENLSDIPEGVRDKNQCIVDVLEQNTHAWGAVHNKLFKSSLFNETRFPIVRHLEDYKVTIKFFNEANGIYFCKYPYYHHTCNVSSLSQGKWNQEWLTIPNTTEDIINYIMLNNIDESVKKATYRFRFLMLLSVLWKIYREKPNDAKQIKNNLHKESLHAFNDYIMYAEKKRGDIKHCIKYILALM